VIPRLVLGSAALVLLVGCSSSGDDPPWFAHDVSVDAAHAAAARAGSSPRDCPLRVDVPGVVRSAGVDEDVRLSEASATAAERDEPVEDPLGAQRQGMSAVDALAGAEIECAYRAGEGEVTVYFAVTRTSSGALNMFGPVIQKEAKLPFPELRAVLASPAAEGEAKVVAGTVAMVDLAAEGGDAAVVVSSSVPGLRDDALRGAARTIAGAIPF
jgi:hypothetical protein